MQITKTYTCSSTLLQEYNWLYVPCLICTIFRSVTVFCGSGLSELGVMHSNLSAQTLNKHSIFKANAPPLCILTIWLVSNSSCVCVPYWCRCVCVLWVWPLVHVCVCVCALFLASLFVCVCVVDIIMSFNWWPLVGLCVLCVCVCACGHVSVSIGGRCACVFQLVASRWFVRALCVCACMWTCVFQLVANKRFVCGLVLSD